MQEKTTTVQQKSSTLESNEQMTTKKPPVFQLMAADGGNGGGGNGGGNGAGGKNSGTVSGSIEGNDRYQSYSMKAQAVGDPTKNVPPALPGQVAWVHSPCFSQELEAEAFKVAAGRDYRSGSSKISETILKLSTTPFRNAAGQENDWAKRMMGDTVLMNPGNKAATIVGSGYPKLVILTFWNDPSNPETGGVNYGYFIDISYNMFPEEAKKDGGGGMIFCGDLDNNKPDLSHYSKQVVEINEWMIKVLEFMKACQAGARPDPVTTPSSIPGQLKFLFEQFKKGYDIVDKAQGVGSEADRQHNENVAKEKYEKEQTINIEGHHLEKDKKYLFFFRDRSGEPGSVECTPGYFRNYQLNRGYQYVKHQVR